MKEPHVKMKWSDHVWGVGFWSGPGSIEINTDTLISLDRNWARFPSSFQKILIDMELVEPL